LRGILFLILAYIEGWAYGINSVPAKSKAQTYFKTFTTQKVYMANKTSFRL